MKFFKNKFNKKAVFLTISTMFLLFLGSTQFTHAQTIFGGIESGVISYVAYGLTYLIATLFAIIIGIEAWVVGVVLNINANILQTSFVQTGFSISLSIANLAFVLGIIVIALATILRSQTYGIKQLLWKLVVMAILVNFGLVIMSPIFAIGNSFSQYFLDCINPGAGGCTTSASGVSTFFNFGTTFAGAFNPAKGFVAPEQADVAALTALQSGNVTGAFGISGSSLGNTLVPVFGIAFVAIDLILIVIILGAFIALLIVRYLYIAILAILLPFAWASWVFPSFNSHWKKWWENFFRWTFFAPLVLFFIYLALLTMQGVGATGVFAYSTYTGSNDGAWSAISAFFSGAFSPIISSFLQEILLGGLIIGGMIAADSMGIKMAGTMVKAGEKGGKAIRGAAWNATKRRTTDRLRTMGRKTSADGKETTTTLQRIGSRLQNVPVPGFKPLGSAIANQGAPAVFQKQSAENIKKYIDGELTGLDNKGLIARANGSDVFINPTGAAAIGQELARRNLTADPTLKAGRIQDFLKVSERMGNTQAILNNRPELAAQTSAAIPKEVTDATTGLRRLETTFEASSRAIAEATKKIKVADTLEINSKSMGDPTTAFPSQSQRDVAVNMSLQQLRKLGAEGSPEQTKALKDTINKMVAAAITPGAPPYPPDTLDKLNNLHNYIDNSIQWQYV